MPDRKRRLTPVGSKEYFDNIYLPIENPPRPLERPQETVRDPIGGLPGKAFTRGVGTAARGVMGAGEILSAPLPEFLEKYPKAAFKSGGDAVDEMLGTLPRDVPSFTEIEGPGDAGRFAVESVGEMVGYLAPTVLGTILTGGASGAASATAKAVGSNSSAAMAKGVAKQVATRMAPFAAVTESGNIFRNIRDKTGIEAPGTSAVFGAAAGALETLGATKALEKILDGPATAAKKKLLGEFMGSVLNSAVQTGAIEGVTEVGQETLGILAETFADEASSFGDQITSDNLIQLTDAFLAGAIGGGTLGGGGKAAQPALAKLEAKLKAKELKETEEALKGLRSEAEKEMVRSAINRYHQGVKRRRADRAAEGVPDLTEEQVEKRLAEARQEADKQPGQPSITETPEIAQAREAFRNELIRVLGPPKTQEQTEIVPATQSAPEAAPQQNFTPVPVERPVNEGADETETALAQALPDELEEAAQMASRSELDPANLNFVDENQKLLFYGRLQNLVGKKLFPQYAEKVRSILGLKQEEQPATPQEAPAAPPQPEPEPAPSPLDNETVESLAKRKAKDLDSLMTEAGLEIKPKQTKKQKAEQLIAARDRPTPAQRTRSNNPELTKIRKLHTALAKELRSKRGKEDVILTRAEVEMNKLAEAGNQEARDSAANAMANLQEIAKANVAKATRQKTTEPTTGRVSTVDLVNSSGNQVKADVVLADDGTARIEAGGNPQYYTGRKFKNKEQLRKALREGLVDPESWVRYQRASMFFGEDAPLRIADKPVWSQRTINKLHKDYRNLLGAYADPSINADLLASILAHSNKRVADMTPNDAAQEFEKTLLAYAKNRVGRMGNTKGKKDQAQSIKRAIRDIQNGKRNTKDVNLLISTTEISTDVVGTTGQRGTELTVDPAAPTPDESIGAFYQALAERLKLKQDLINKQDMQAAIADVHRTGDSDEKDGFKAMFAEQLEEVPESNTVDPQTAFGLALENLADKVYGQYQQELQSTGSSSLALERLANRGGPGAGAFGLRSTQRNDARRKRSREAKSERKQRASHAAVGSRLSAFNSRGIQRLVRDPELGFPQELIDFTDQFFENINPIYTEHLNLQVVDSISLDDDGFELVGTFEPVLKKIQILRDTDDPATVAHEMSHHLYYYLPNEVRSKVHEAYEADLRVASVRNENLDDPKFYHLKNPEEYFVAGLLNASRPQRSVDSVWDYVLSFIDQLIAVAKRVFSKKAQLFDQISQGFFEGAFPAVYNEYAAAQSQSRLGALAPSSKKFKSTMNFTFTPEARRRETLSAKVQNVPLQRAAETLDLRPDQMPKWVNNGISTLATVAAYDTDEAIKVYSHIKDRDDLSAEDKNSIAIDMAQRYRQLEKRLRKKVIQSHNQRQLIESRGPEIQGTKKEVKAKLDLLRESQIKVLTANIKAEIGKLEKQIRKAGDSAEATRLRQELKFWNNALSERAGVQQLVNHLLEVVNLHNEGAQILENPKLVGRDLIRAYDQVLTRQQPNTKINLSVEHSANAQGYSKEALDSIKAQAENLQVQKRHLFKMAADLAARQKWLTRDIAALDSAVKSETQISPKDVQKAVGGLLNSFQKLTRQEADKMRQIKALDNKLASMIRSLDKINHEVELITIVLNDPVNRQAYIDAIGGLDIATPPAWVDEDFRWDSITGKVSLPMPDGEYVELDLSVEGDTMKKEIVARIENAGERIKLYLSSPEGQNDPRKPFWENGLRVLEGVYDAGRLFKKVESREWFQAGLGIISDMLLKIGTPTANAAINQATNLDRSADRLRQWMREHSPRIIKAMLRATKSHNANFGTLSTEEAVQEWYERVFREIAGVANIKEIELKPGDQIAPDLFVTKEDMAAFREILAVTDMVYKIDPTVGKPGALEQTLEDDFAPGMKLRRRPVKRHKFMLPRTFSREGVDLSRAYSYYRWEHPNEAELINKLDSYITTAIKAWASDRNPDFASPKPRGFLGGFDNLAKAITKGEVHDFNDAVEFMTQYLDPDYVEEIQSSTEAEVPHDQIAKDLILRDLDSQMRRIRDETQNAEVTDEKILFLNEKNSFTSARQGPIANYFFYDYGPRNSAAILNFAADGWMYYHQNLVNSLEGLANEMSEKISRLRSASKRGENNYEELEKTASQKSSLDRLIHDLKWAESWVGRKAQMDWRIARRTFGYLVGAAIANPITGVINQIHSYVRLGLTYQAIMGTRVANPLWAWDITKSAIHWANIQASGAAGGMRAALKELQQPSEEGGPSKSRRVSLKFAQEFINQKWAKDLAAHQQGRQSFIGEMIARGYFPFESMERFENILDSPATGGALYSHRAHDNRNIAKFHDVTSSGITYLGLMFAEIPGLVFPREFDVAGNMGAIALARRIQRDLELQALRVVENLGRDGLKAKFNLDKPKDLNNRVPAEMAIGGLGISNNNLLYLHDLAKKADIDLDTALVSYYDKVSQLSTPQERDQVRLFDEDQRINFGLQLMEDVNKPTTSNRPTFLRKNTTGQILFPIMGWPMRAMMQTVKMATRAANDPNRTVGQLRTLQALSIMGLLASSAWLHAGAETLLRLIYKYVIGEERPGRLPWEEDHNWPKAKRWAIMAFTGAPLINTIPNVMFNDSPNAASMGLELFLQNKVKDALRYSSGVLATGDLTYGLADTFKRTFPIARAVANRMPGHTGVIQVRSMTRLLQRYGPPEIRHETPGFSSGFASNATVITPYGRRLVNAAMEGDIARFRQLYQEGLQVAKDAGREQPDQSIKQVFLSQNPIRRAFRTTPSQEQYQRILDKMTPSEKEEFEEVMRRYIQAAHAIGASVNFYDTPKVNLEPRRDRQRLTGAFRLR